MSFVRTKKSFDSNASIEPNYVEARQLFKLGQMFEFHFKLNSLLTNGRYNDRNLIYDPYHRNVEPRSSRSFVMCRFLSVFLNYYFEMMAICSNY